MVGQVEMVLDILARNSCSMPGVDFQVLRGEITIELVLKQLGIVPQPKRTSAARAMSDSRLDVRQQPLVVRQPQDRAILLP